METPLSKDSDRTLIHCLVFYKVIICPFRTQKSGCIQKHAFKTIWQIIYILGLSTY